MDIRPLTKESEDAYRAFLRDDPGHQVYGSLEYRNFLSAVVPGQSHYLLAWDSGEIVGAFPYFRQACPGFGVVVNSLPWYGSHGGCLLSPKAGNEVRKALLGAYKEAVLSPGVLSSTVILTPGETTQIRHYVEMLKPDFLDQRVGQVTVLPEDGPDLEKRLEKLFTARTRRHVRKSFKQGFSLRTQDQEWAWQFLCATHQANMAAIGGRAKRWADFLAIRKHIPAAWRTLLVAMDGEIPVAGLLLLYFNRTVEYFTPAIRVEHRSRQPLSFLIWHGMLDAIKNGYRWWNWGGTWESQRSLHYFKTGWGAEDRPYTYLIHLADGALEKLEAHQKNLQDMFFGYYTHPYNLVKA